MRPGGSQGTRPGGARGTRLRKCLYAKQFGAERLDGSQPRTYTGLTSDQFDGTSGRGISMHRTRPIAPAVFFLALTMVVAGRLVAFSTVEAQGQREGRMYVSVLDRAGDPATGLSPAEFVVREDGVRRDVLRACPASDPLTIAIVVDNSSAASASMNDIRHALTAFVQKVHEGNAIALVSVGDRPTVLVNYTLDLPQLGAGISRLFPQPRSGSYLLDALMEVSRGIVRQEAARRVIVAIATEGPEFSNRQSDLVVKTVADSGAALHMLVLTTPGGGDMMSEEARNRNRVIDEGTQATGGRRDNLLSSMALGPDLAKLAAELATQYLVVYGRPESLIPPERIEVSVSRPGLVARGTPVKARPGA